MGRDGECRETLVEKLWWREWGNGYPKVREEERGKTIR